MLRRHLLLLSLPHVDADYVSVSDHRTRPFPALHNPFGVTMAIGLMHCI